MFVIGSDGLKDSRMDSDSLMVSVMRLLLWAGRRIGGGNERPWSFRRAD